MDLAWTVPHDDTGVVAYDIRVSGNPITENNWGSAFQLSAGGGAVDEGKLEVKTLSNVAPDKRMFIAVKAQDGAGNESAFSNVIEVHTKKRENTGPASVQPRSGNSGGDASASAVTQEPLTPHNQGTVRMVIKTPSGGVPEDMIFVNFISIDTGVTFGGSAIDGMLAIELPKGKYKIRFMLAPQYAEPRSLSPFEITDNGSVDLGVITLEPGSGATMADVAAGKGGIARILGFMVKLLFEILKKLDAILAKMS